MLQFKKENEELDKISQGQGMVANLQEFEGDIQGQGTEENETQPLSSNIVEKKEAQSNGPSQNILKKSPSINRKSTDKKEQVKNIIN